MHTVALPIKIKNREYYGKLWLALHLISPGTRVVVGDINGLNNTIPTEIQPDVYVAENGRRTGYVFEEVKRSESSLVFLDSEGGGWNDHYADSIDEDFLNAVSLVLTWGKKTENILVKDTDYPPERIRTTGNPRFDLLQPGLRDVYRDEATRIRNRFGDYILFNMNFSFLTDFYKDEFETYIKTSDLPYSEALQQLQNETVLMLDFFEAVERIYCSELLYNVIIRPHPSVEADFYRDRFRNYNSVFVEKSGDVRPWIIGADAVVHNNCTTGIESVLLNTPTISLTPDFEKAKSETRTHLSNEVSIKVQSVDELLKTLRTTVSGNCQYTLSEKQMIMLKQYFANIDTLAAPAAAAAIEEIRPEQDSLSYSKPDLRQRMKTSLKNTSIIPYIYYLRGILTGSDRTVERSKFKGLSRSEVSETIDILQEVSELPNTPLTIKKINELHDVYIIEQ